MKLVWVRKIHFTCTCEAKEQFASDTCISIGGKTNISPFISSKFTPWLIPTFQSPDFLHFLSSASSPYSWSSPAVIEPHFSELWRSLFPFSKPRCLTDLQTPRELPSAQMLHVSIQKQHFFLTNSLAVTCASWHLIDNTLQFPRGLATTALC